MSALNNDSLLLQTPCSRWVTRQAIAFDWYDGPREGMCALSAPKYEFYFELHSEKYSPNGMDDRVYLISRIKFGSVNRILRALKPLGEPLSSVWVPNWKFPNKALRLKAEKAIELVRNSKIETGVIVRSEDMITFTDCLNIARETKRFLSWFEYKGPAVEHEFASAR